MTAAQLTETRTGYLRKLRVSEWRSWVRLLTFRSDFRMIARALFKPIQARIRRSRSTPENLGSGRSARQHQSAVRAGFSQHGDHVATRSAGIRRVRSAVLGVRGQVPAAPRPSLEPHATWYRVHVTPQANHIFSSSEWQEDLFEQCCGWLEERAARMGRAPPRSLREVGAREKLTPGERA